MDGQEVILDFLEVYMEKHNFKKKYGQNFLRNDVILNDIVSSFECDNNSKIINQIMNYYFNIL